MTYQVFFNLDDAPFRLTPDPEYYFASKRHSEALETLFYCVETGEGFVQVTGEPGVGKTLLIRSFLDQLGSDVNTALILHPRLEPEELLKIILEDLGLAPEDMQEMSKESLLRAFRDLLLQSAKQGFRTVVIIDEAHEIPEKTLEELRLLSNLETEKTKLLQIILVGQRELEEKLSQESLKQLHQRITIRYRLDTLTLDETVNYIHHRLKVAGGGNISRFNQDVIEKIHAISNGIPRIINTLCERSLMAAFVDGKSTVHQQHLNNAVQSLEFNTLDTAGGSKKKQLFFFLFMAMILAPIALYFSNTPFQKLINLKTHQLVVFVQAKKTDFILAHETGTPCSNSQGNTEEQGNKQPEQQEQVASADSVDHENGSTATITDKAAEKNTAVHTEQEETTAIQPTSAPLTEAGRNEVVHEQVTPEEETEKPVTEERKVEEPAKVLEEYEYATVLPQAPPEVSAQEERGHSTPKTVGSSDTVTESEDAPVKQQPPSATIKNSPLPPGWQSISIENKKARTFSK